MESLPEMFHRHFRMLPLICLLRPASPIRCKACRCELMDGTDVCFGPVLDLAEAAGEGLAFAHGREGRVRSRGAQCRWRLRWFGYPPRLAEV